MTQGHKLHAGGESVNYRACRRNSKSGEHQAATSACKRARSGSSRSNFARRSDTREPSTPLVDAWVLGVSAAKSVHGLENGEACMSDNVELADKDEIDIPIVVMQRTHCEADHNAWLSLRMETMDEKLPQDEFHVQRCEDLEVWGDDLEEW